MELFRHSRVDESPVSLPSMGCPSPTNNSISLRKHGSLAQVVPKALPEPNVSADMLYCYRIYFIGMSAVECRMSKEAVFTMKLEPALRARFMAVATSEDRPASQIVRELMRDYIEQREQAREYEDYLRRKVEAGRLSMRAGRGRTNDEVEAAFAAKRKQLQQAWDEGQKDD